MLGMPATTQFDLNFRLLGIPVRINPFFWVMAAVLGWGGRDTDGLEVVVWVACVFVSILVHEFGHGLTARAFTRQQPAIVLYAMGGLCFSDQERISPWKRLGVILMGPGAGFLLFALVATIEATFLGSINFGPFRVYFHDAPAWANHLIYAAFANLLWINLFWGIFNLFPIFPLDGGQAAQTLLSMQNRQRAASRTYILSMVTAGLLAVVLYQQTGEPLNSLFVGYLGLINFQLYQASQFQAGSRGAWDDDEDWWKR
ncbi:metalloprotease [Tundrisphaera lichenicola]|uniref:metalloprotease n=1 Tax=Tundrisphaera lichenicola TaxID=2029860 RepID=UPI003EBFC9E9